MHKPTVDLSMNNAIQNVMAWQLLELLQIDALTSILIHFYEVFMLQ